eukprot:3334094-Heterocapsa_arctica.AAC.1
MAENTTASCTTTCRRSPSMPSRQRRSLQPCHSRAHRGRNGRCSDERSPRSGDVHGGARCAPRG